MAYLRINVSDLVEREDGEIEEEYYNFGETVKVDISKYIGLSNEPVSFMFRPNQAQLASKADIPLIVKVDAEISVRPSSTDITSLPEYDDDEDEKREEQEIIK